MSEPDHTVIVERAQRGDSAAFTELVGRFQDLAVGTAFGWFGEIESARDAAQEAFLDAHRHLDQLRDPGAFPGWFRRIVIKHCDRATRRTRPDSSSAIASDAEAATSPDLTPESIAAATEQARNLRFAVDALPPAERMVVALQYFAEATGPEVARFLELPESTVKKRLRQARQRLHEQGERLMQKTIHDMRPSASGTFAEEICFFIALRAGDLDEVHRLLQNNPALVETPQDWDPQLVRDGVLPFANKATPLITAIERGDLAMQRLLIEAGADVDGRCSCATGEAPIWTAALFNRLDHASDLLAAGADPNQLSSSGNSPLHLTAMRGLEAMTRLLLEHGADPSLRDAGGRKGLPWSPADDSPPEDGRTAEEWAVANGHLAVATLIGSAAATAAATEDGQQHPSSDVVPVGDILHTGIKALDLFAPIVAGGVIRFPFMAGVGMLVLLGELCQRFLSMSDGAALWTGFTQPPFDLEDWHADMAEFGLADRIHSHLAGFHESPETRREAMQDGIRLAETLRDSNHRVLAIILSSQGFENEVEASLLRLRAESPAGSITSVIITPFPESTDPWTELNAPFSAQITLDRARAQRQLFPALHPSRSLSAGLSADAVGVRHVALARASAALLDDYQRDDADFEQLDSADHGAETRRAIQLLRYLCQPFSITEPFTGRPGETVDRATLLNAVDAILHGPDAQPSSAQR